MIADKKWILTNYERFNAQYFKGELPNITAKLSHARKYLGRASASFDLDTRSMCDFTITMSNYFDQPEEVMNATLLHEMIHIKDYYKNGTEIFEKYWADKKHRGHGDYFLTEAARITKESGYQIDVRASQEVMSQCVLSEHTRQKLETPYLMFVSNSFRIGCGAFRLPKNVTATDIQNLIKYNHLESGYVIEGVFNLFAGKRGSMKTGKCISSDNYEMYLTQARKASPAIYPTDSLQDILNKINNRK